MSVCVCTYICHITALLGECFFSYDKNNVFIELSNHFTIILSDDLSITYQRWMYGCRCVCENQWISWWWISDCRCCLL